MSNSSLRMSPRVIGRLSVLVALLVGNGITRAAEPVVIPLWSGKAPGEVKEFPPEADINKPTDKPVGDRPIIKLTNVTQPTLSLYLPKEAKSKLAVIVCPGGGHNILAFDHEGTEVAEWLNTLGVTAFVLKYRVPARNPDKRWEASVQDAQRAVSLIRHRAAEWKIDPQKIGMIGFSAGGQTAGLTALLHTQRQYPATDEIDKVSSRPDFAALIYPAYFTKKDAPWTLADDVKVDATTPPMFFAHSANDPVTVASSVLLFAELKKNKIDGELHAYATGGHGYGIRKTGHPCNGWPQRLEEWMRSQKYLVTESP